MRLNHATVTTLFTLSNTLLGVSAGPLKRQDEVTSSVRSVASVGVVADGSSTYEALAPTPAPSTTGSAGASPTATSIEPSKTTLTFSPTGEGQPPSTGLPSCNKKKSDLNPFCFPSEGQVLYHGTTYYARWNPLNYNLNTTIVVQLRFDNDSSQQVWSSGRTENGMGFVDVPTRKEWMQGYSAYNLTFHFVSYDASAPIQAAETLTGPQITLRDPPPNHYKPPGPTKLHKEGLLIGLPVTLGALALISAGLYIGMRKHRTIGLGNIMGRRKGYGVGKSRSQRMGFGKKKGGAIRLEGGDDFSRPQFQSAHIRGDSLGSLMSDDGIRAVPVSNHFRSEIERQKTGR